MHSRDLDGSWQRGSRDGSPLGNTAWVFAFIGFEGLANIAQEVKEPRRTLPIAIFLTLGISTFFYIVIVWIALVSVPPDQLASASAPLSLVFERVTGASPVAISAIAIVATINRIIALMVMSPR